MREQKNTDAERLNPCFKEQNLTYKCFDRNNYDKESCALEIENYKVCKTFWSFAQAYRRKHGIHPYLPPLEEREQVKKELMGQFKN